MNETHTTIDESLPQSVMERVDAVCDRFEDAWLAGQRPRIEDYLGAASDERTLEALLRELIALDVFHRQKRGETVFSLDYHRFATLPADLLVPAAVSTGSALERYRLGEKIGAGGMGEVRRCHDLRLNRDLAIKVLRQEHRGDTCLQQRFLEEARIGGRLQHPGIVPVHDLGELSDGRPFFTMKLVEGRTLAVLLTERSEPSQDLPRFLSIFEQICQTLAYAHAQGVIHRDLKPSNVMVGAFGEVQVMDWGLAKELQRGFVEEAATGRDTAVYSAVEKDTSWQMRTQPGQAMGTYCYMPPEQARGEVERIDERSDVFGLGAILCEILTGQPPITGRNSYGVLDKAKACDHAEAMARLDACGADAELLRLAKASLAAVPADRPQNADVVAKEVKAYLVGVQERLLEADRERAAAQAREEEAKKTAAAEQARADEARKTVAAERRTRRRMLRSFLAVLLFVAGIGSLTWWQHRIQQVEKAELLTKLAQQESREEAKELPSLGGEQASAGGAPALTFDGSSVMAWETMQSAAAKSEKIALEKTRARAEEQKDQLKQMDAATKRDHRLLAALLEVHTPREAAASSRDGKSRMRLVEPSADEQLAAALRDWGLDVEAVPVAKAAERLLARPEVVVTEVIAALDERASQLRVDQEPKEIVRGLIVADERPSRLRVNQKTETARHVAELAAVLNFDPGSLRRELRALVRTDQLPVERAMSVLATALRPVPIPIVIPLGKNQGRLRRLATKTNPASKSVLGLLTLARTLRMAGEEALAERMLRDALIARPREVVLYHALGKLLTTQKPTRWGEAVEFYRAARSLRPELGVNLAMALLHSGHSRESLNLLTHMVQERPDNSSLLFQQGFALAALGKYAEAEAAYRKAIALKPDNPSAYVNLGVALNGQGKLVEAEAACRKAIALKPNLADAYNNLGETLELQGNLAEAKAAYRKCTALKEFLTNSDNKPTTTVDVLPLPSTLKLIGD